MAAKDLILIKEAHEFFINSGTTDLGEFMETQQILQLKPVGGTGEWRKWTNAYVPLLDEGTFTDNRAISVIYSKFVLLIEL